MYYQRKLVILQVSFLWMACLQSLPEKSPLAITLQHDTGSMLITVLCNPNQGLHQENHLQVSIECQLTGSVL